MSVINSIPEAYNVRYCLTIKRYCSIPFSIKVAAPFISMIRSRFKFRDTMGYRYMFIHCTLHTAVYTRATSITLINSSYRTCIIKNDTARQKKGYVTVGPLQRQPRVDKSKTRIFIVIENRKGGKTYLENVYASGNSYT